MPDMTVTLPAPAAAIQPTAAGASATDATDTASPVAGADFSSVLRQQLAQQPQGGGNAVPAALAQIEADQVDQADQAQDTPAIGPDLSSLLPGLAAMAVSAVAAAAPATAAAGDIKPETGNALAALAAAAGAPSPATSALPNLPDGSGKNAVPAEEMATAASGQPAVLAATAKPQADPAASAPALREFRLPEMPAENAASPTQPNAAMQPAHASRSNEAPAVVHVETPAGARGWDNEVAQKVVWLASRDASRAEMTLNPPHLGKLEVTLTVSGDQTNALFVSASPATREALENALPRLREILADAGITLGQSSVNAESPKDSDEGGRRSGAGGAREAVAGDVGTAAPASWISRGNGLIDTFA
jgi:flagellar hook-length control protein FliK